MEPSGASRPASGRSLRAWLARPLVLYPLLVGIPPILDYTYENRKMAEPWAALWPIGLTLLVTVAIALLLQQVLGSAKKAGAITALWMLGFHSHGHVGAWDRWMWGAIALATVGFVLWRGTLEVLTTFANVFAALAVAWPTWTLVSFNLQDHRPHVRPDLLASMPLEPRSEGPRPDIYWIVLDGYGRADVLEEMYDHHDTFVDHLRERGFYVADKSHSNYAQTALAFSAVTNLAYVDDLLVDHDRTTMYRLPLQQLCRDNRLVHALRGAGYDIVQYPSEYSVTHFADVDDNRHPLVWSTEFGYHLVNNTPIPDVLSAFGQPRGRLQHAVRRNHQQWVLDRLAEPHGREAPTFVYAHLVVPHPPFVFNADGSYRPARATHTFTDGAGWLKQAKRYKESYEAGYTAQVAYVGRELGEAVDAIVSRPDRPAIVVIQGDHGPAAHLSWGSRQQTDVNERMPILNAYYFPDGDYGALYPEITPVNSFRVVLDRVLGTELGTLPDKSYYSTWAKPYKFVDVTKDLRALKPASDAPSEPPAP